MKFKIKKEVDEMGVWYVTVPKNIFIRIWYTINFMPPFELSPLESFQTKEEAIQHIKKWNSGYYKKKHYSKWV